MEASEIWTNLGLLLGGIMLAIAAYRGKSVPPAPKPQSEAVLAGVGIELSNRDQMERLIEKLDRIAKALENLADHRQADMQETLDELLERMKEAERRR